MNIRPYIGITGIENSYHLSRIFPTFSERGNIPHLIMVGALVSYKTLINIKDKPITLMEDEVRDIFRTLKKFPTKDILFTLHYFTKPLKQIKPELKERAKNIVEKSLYQQISQLVENLYEEYETTNPDFQMGIQINMKWPDPQEVNQIKTDYPRLKTILQISDFSSLAERISKYNIDYALIDASRGKGIEFDMDEIIGTYNIIKKNNPAMIGFAGGLSPENIKEKVCSLKEKLNTKNFCVDAEGRLRIGKYLLPGKVKRYLENAIEAFQENF